MSALLTRRPYPRTVTGRFTDVTPDPAMVARYAALPAVVLRSVLVPHPDARDYAARNVAILAALGGAA